jgi:peptide/histidine transporter 3/4
MERVSYYGITANLVLYMKNSMHFGAASAAQNVSNWLGATTILPIFGAFIADTYWGKYWTIVYLSTFYVLVSKQKDYCNADNMLL